MVRDKKMFQNSQMKYPKETNENVKKRRKLLASPNFFF